MVPAGETTEEHRAQQQEEAGRLDKDRAIGATTGKGLFGVRFRDSGPRRIPIIRDVEDGVDRCPACTWELEDGWCESCGYIADGHSGSDLSDSERSYYIGEDLGDDFLEHPMMRDDVGIDFPGDGRHVPFDHAPSVDSDGNTIDEDLDAELDARAYQALAAARGRARYPLAATVRGTGHWHTHDLHGSSSEGDYDDEEGFPDTEQYSSDGTAGSLDDFIADDQSGGPPLEHSRRNSQYGSDDGTETAMDFDPEYAEGNRGSHEPHLDETMVHEDFTPGIRDSDDDSDGSPVARRRRIQAPTIDSDDDAGILALHASRLQPPRNRIGFDRLTAPNTFSRSEGTNRARFERDYSPDYRLRGGGTSQQAPIEIGSDSDVPAPVPRSRRNRQIVDPETSDDDGAAGHSSHSATSGTVRTVSVTDLSTGQNMQLRRRPSSHISRNSGESPTVEGSDRTEWSPPHGHYKQGEEEDLGDAANQSDASISSFVDAPQSPRTAIGRPNTNTRPSRVFSRHNRMVPPRRTRNRVGPGQSLASRVASATPGHSAGHAPNSEASVRFYGSDEARAAAKAERKRLKRERRLRNRESDGSALER